jgi:hypothetical protein
MQHSPDVCRLQSLYVVVKDCIVNIFEQATMGAQTDIDMARL